MTARNPPAPGEATPPPTASSAILAFCGRHHVSLAIVVLGLAAFNVLWRLGSESVTEWDESLYAISALETAEKGNWIAITFRGALDYYNAKPPLNIWLIALAFKAFGVSLVSLRLVSALSAWLTVAALMEWTRRCIGTGAGLFSGLALSTTFGFLYVHSGRTANADALFTLLILLTVVTLWAARTQPWHRVWLGLLAAAAFLLKGTAVMMPLAIVAAVEMSRKPRQPNRWIPMGAAGLLFLAPVAAWAAARWQVDGWRFFERLVNYDLLARALFQLEGHRGSPFYYLNILHKYQYDWLAAGVLAWILFPVAWPRLRGLLLFWRADDGPRVEIGCWAVITLLIPTLMRTKASWYLNPFYPVFALGVGSILAHGLSRAGTTRGDRSRSLILWCVVILTLVVAQGKLMWHSFHRRDAGLSVQGLLLAERDRVGGHWIFRDHWDNAEIFVIEGLLNSRHGLAADVPMFLRDSRPGDFLISSPDVQRANLVLERSDGRYWLYRRRE